MFRAFRASSNGPVGALRAFPGWSAWRANWALPDSWHQLNRTPWPLEFLTMFFTRQRPRPGKTSQRRRPYSLPVERLEDRLVPSAAVWTDKLDYHPDETAIITGSQFGVGETVQLQVLHTDGTPNTGPAHAPWLVTDGDTGAPFQDAAGVWHLPDLDGQQDGAFQTTWAMDEDAGGSTFQVTAAGLTSGSMARATFTDAP